MQLLFLSIFGDSVLKQYLAKINIPCELNSITGGLEIQTRLNLEKWCLSDLTNCKSMLEHSIHNCVAGADKLGCVDVSLPFIYLSRQNYEFTTDVLQKLNKDPFFQVHLMSDPQLKTISHTSSGRAVVKINLFDFLHLLQSRNSLLRNFVVGLNPMDCLKYGHTLSTLMNTFFIGWERDAIALLFAETIRAPNVQNQQRFIWLCELLRQGGIISEQSHSSLRNELSGSIQEFLIYLGSNIQNLLPPKSELRMIHQLISETGFTEEARIKVNELSSKAPSSCEKLFSQYYKSCEIAKFSKDKQYKPTSTCQNLAVFYIYLSKQPNYNFQMFQFLAGNPFLVSNLMAFANINHPDIKDYLSKLKEKNELIPKFLSGVNEFDLKEKDKIGSNFDLLVGGNWAKTILMTMIKTDYVADLSIASAFNAFLTEELRLTPSQTNQLTDVFTNNSLLTDKQSILDQIDALIPNTFDSPTADNKRQREGEREPPIPRQKRRKQLNPNASPLQ